MTWMHPHKKEGLLRRMGHGPCSSLGRLLNRLHLQPSKTFFCMWMASPMISTTQMAYVCRLLRPMWPAVPLAFLLRLLWMHLLRFSVR